MLVGAVFEDGVAEARPTQVGRTERGDWGATIAVATAVREWDADSDSDGSAG